MFRSRPMLHQSSKVLLSLLMAYVPGVMATYLLVYKAHIIGSPIGESINRFYVLPLSRALEQLGITDHGFISVSAGTVLLSSPYAILSVIIFSCLRQRFRPEFK